MKTIKLQNSNLVALVDDEDFEKLNNFKWCYSRTHAVTGWAENNTRWSMQEMVIGYDEHLEIDHINRNGLDNQKINLRRATRSQNKANRGVFKNNTSGFKGVYYFRRALPWRAKIVCNSKIHYLGQFASKVEAAVAYDKKATELFGEFACLNFPKGKI